MAFNFGELIKKETEKVELATQTKGSGIGYKTLYPFDPGKFELKLIANEPSGLIYREIIFHEVIIQNAQGNSQKVKVPCLKHMCGEGCKICDMVNKVQDELKDEKVFSKYGFKKQGIMFAKLISMTPDNYFGDNRNPPKPGEIVLFMFPKSVITELSNLIVEYQDDLENIFANNTTRTVTFKVGKQANGFNEYIFYVKNTNAILCEKENGEEDNEAFKQLMANMPDLREVKFSTSYTENDIKTIDTIIERMSKEYFAGAYNIPVSDSLVSSAPVAPKVEDKPVTTNENVSAPVVNDTGDKPACFGDNKYEGDCLTCKWTNECV